MGDPFKNFYDSWTLTNWLALALHIQILVADVLPFYGVSHIFLLFLSWECLCLFYLKVTKMDSLVMETGDRVVSSWISISSDKLWNTHTLTSIPGLYFGWTWNWITLTLNDKYEVAIFNDFIHCKVFGLLPVPNPDF